MVARRRDPGLIANSRVITVAVAAAVYLGIFFGLQRGWEATVIAFMVPFVLGCTIIGFRVSGIPGAVAGAFAGLFNVPGLIVMTWWAERKRQPPSGSCSCGYEFTGSSTGHCPDCGAPVVSEPAGYDRKRTR